MRLLATHPGFSVDDVQGATDFELIVSEDLQTTEPPPPDVLDTMKKIDPTGMVIGD